MSRCISSVMCDCVSVGDIVVVFFFKQKTAYEMRISDWSSDVCSSDLLADVPQPVPAHVAFGAGVGDQQRPPITLMDFPQDALEQIGRASCRERVCQYV